MEFSELLFVNFCVVFSIVPLGAFLMFLLNIIENAQQLEVFQHGERDEEPKGTTLETHIPEGNHFKNKIYIANVVELIRGTVRVGTLYIIEEQ